jgi:hypothetical protein
MCALRPNPADSLDFGPICARIPERRRSSPRCRRILALVAGDLPGFGGELDGAAFEPVLPLHPVSLPLVLAVAATP